MLSALPSASLLGFAPPKPFVLRVDSTAAEAFRTLHAARDAMRAGLGHGFERHIHIAGDHKLDRPLVLDARDSGSPEAPIVYATDPTVDATAALSGGVQVPATAWERAVGPTGIPLLKASLFDLGLNGSLLGGLQNPYPAHKLELFYGGRPMTLARDPSIAPNGTWQFTGYDAAVPLDNSSLALDDAAYGARWAAALADGDDLWLHGFFKFDWRDTYLRLASIARVNSSRWNLTRAEATPPQYPWVRGCRFYALNALRLLDSPGEYFVDARTGALWFLPPGGVPAAGAPLPEAAAVSVLGSVLVLDGVSHTHFANLTLATAQGEVVMATAVSAVTFSNLTVANAGAGCFSLSGANASVSGLAVSGCGAAAVSVSGGSATTLEPANITVRGCSVTDFARVRRTYEPGVHFDCVGCLVANNTITHAPHAAIQGGGNDNVFEHNRITHACYGSIDVGAFYVGRSWAQRGNVVRFNRFEHIRPTERLAQQSCSQNAFYLDDQMSGYAFYENTIVNATTGVLLGGGRRNHIHDNVFLSNDKDVAFDDRGLTWQQTTCQQNCTPAYPPGSTSCFYNALAAVNYKQPPYATRYPEIVNIYEDHPCLPVGNVIENNRWCHRGSKPGAQFVDRSDETIRGWLSEASNNVEDCTF